MVPWSGMEAAQILMDKLEDVAGDIPIDQNDAEEYI